MPKIVKIKRSNVAGSTPTLSYGELGYNAADNKLFAGNAANSPVVVGAGGSSGGGGGSANIVEAATAASFPATGSAGTLYHATDVSRIYFWDASGVYVEVGTAGGGGSGSGGDGTDSVLRALFVPGAPTSVTATGGTAQATVSWTAPTGVLSQAPINDYVVQFSSNSGSSWTTFSDGTSTTTSATVTGLTNGTAYTFRVAATSSLGQGAWSTASSAVTPTAVQFALIPQMTSNTQPSGQVLTFGDIKNGYLSNGSDSAWYWFSRSDTTDPTQPVVGVGSGIGYAFDSARAIGGFTVMQSSRYAPNYAEGFTFSGSNDGTTWTTLYQATGLTSGWNTGTPRNFTLSSNATYSRYRWIMDACPNTYAEWCKVQLLQ